MAYTFAYGFRTERVQVPQPDGLDRRDADVLGLADGGAVVALRRGNSSYQLNFYDRDKLGDGPLQGEEPRVVDVFGGGINGVVDEPSMTQLANGNVLVTFEVADGEFEIRLEGQIFSASGDAVGGRLSLGFSEDHDFPWRPEVAALQDGGFVLVTDQKGPLYWDRYDANGASAGSFALVGEGRADRQHNVATLNDGGFVVVYQNRGVENEAFRDIDVLCAIYNRDGSIRKAPFSVPGVESGVQEKTKPDVAALDGGGFAVVYADDSLSSLIRGESEGIVLKVFDAQGGLVRTRYVNDVTANVAESDPEIGVTPEGFLFVVWEEGPNVKGRFFGPSGETLPAVGSDQSDVIDIGRGRFADPSVAGLLDGRFVVAHSSDSKAADIRRFEIDVVATGTDDADPYLGQDLKERVNARGGNDLVLGLGGRDQLNGEDGDDFMSGGDDSDILDGGAGDDELYGDAGADRLSGGDGADQLSGGDGSDGLFGGDGLDTLSGGSGDDQYGVQRATLISELGSPTRSVFDLVSEAADGGYDRVSVFTSSGKFAATRYVLPDNVEACDVSGSDAFAVVGNELANSIGGGVGTNRIFGGGGDDALFGTQNSASENPDLLDGGEGDDTLDATLSQSSTLVGGAGDDTFLVASTTDLLVEAADEGRDHARSTVDLTLAANVEDLTLTGPATRATGNELDNVLEGGSFLDGRGGADTMRGGDGDDAYVVDDEGDVVVELETGNVDLVRSSISFVLVDNVENLKLTGASALDGTGNAGANSLEGNAGRNLLNGLGGADTMAGLAGRDVYIVNAKGDVVIESGGEKGGVDEVRSSVDYALGDFVENLDLTKNAQKATGNALDNLITGNAIANRIDGGRGADTLEGGEGADRFAFTTALGKNNVDTITDYLVGRDTILLDNEAFGGLKAGDLKAAAFAFGKRAKDDGDRILYDNKTGALYFDIDGSGDTFEAKLFATIKTGLTTLSADDFVVI